MTVMYIVHPEKDEVSKINHILQGREIGIRNFTSEETSREYLEKELPDICLLPLEFLKPYETAFCSMLKDKVKECPIILLVNKTEISDALQLVGDNAAYDYFLLHPIVDPGRLHIIIEKALSYSAIQLHLESLKQRLSGLPGQVPEALDKNTHKLTGEINTAIDSFKERMKGDEFKQIVKLLDGQAFEKKFADFKKEELTSVIEKNKAKFKTDLTSRLENFSTDITRHLTAAPNVESLQELRRQLNSGFFFDSSELISERPADKSPNLMTDTRKPAVERIVEGISGKVRKVLLIEDINHPTPELTSIVEQVGCKVLSVQSSRKFLHMLKTEQFDCLLVGYDLGDTTGVELIRRVREGLGLKDVPAILLMVNPNSTITSQCKDVGINDVIELPFHPSKLQLVVKDHLTRETSAVH